MTVGCFVHVTGVGTFVIRFLGSEPNELAVSYITPGGEVKSYDISLEYAKDASSGNTIIGYKLGAHIYTSITQLVTSNASILISAHPASKLGLRRYFHGFINFDEASKRLRGKPTGTFLTRFRYSIIMNKIQCFLRAFR